MCAFQIWNIDDVDKQLIESTPSMEVKKKLCGKIDIYVTLEKYSINSKSKIFGTSECPCMKKIENR